MLDEKGRCCGKKPIDYKSGRSTPGGPQLFCPRCDRSYNRVTKLQKPNWAWEQNESGEWVDKVTHIR
jgi:hypothetical protein